MRTLFEKYLQENKIEYDYNDRYYFDCVENCPKCNKVRCW